MRRKLFNVAAAVSLVLCAAMVALWVRSYSYRDYFQLPNRLHALSLEPGQIWIDVADRPYWRGRAYQSFDASKTFNRGHGLFFKVSDSKFNSGTSYSATGFTYVQLQTRDAVGFVAFAIPWWFVCLLLAVAPSIWLLRWQRRRLPGTCPGCGYDLRATPSRCPECGTVPQVGNGKGDIQNIRDGR